MLLKSYLQKKALLMSAIINLFSNKPICFIDIICKRFALMKVLKEI